LKPDCRSETNFGKPAFSLKQSEAIGVSSGRRDTASETAPDVIDKGNDYAESHEKEKSAMTDRIKYAIITVLVLGAATGIAYFTHLVKF
jgi:hypothetical protein